MRTMNESVSRECDRLVNAYGTADRALAVVKAQNDRITKVDTGRRVKRGKAMVAVYVHLLDGIEVDYDRRMEIQRQLEGRLV